MAAPALRPGGLAAVLDFGAARVLCLAAESEGVERGRLIGVGAHAARMTLAGTQPWDGESLARAASIALDQAERMAGRRIETASIVVGDPELRGRRREGSVTLGGRAASPRDAAAALRAAGADDLKPDRALLHLAPLGYRLDDRGFVHDPRGECGDRLAAHACFVTLPIAAEAAPRAALETAGVQVERVIAAPYAAALGAASPSERQAGVVVAEIGAQSTGLAILVNDALIHLESFAFGGRDLTATLGEALGAPFAAAERMKLTHAGWGPGPDSAAVDGVRFDALGRLEPVRVARSRFTEILGPPLDAAVRRLKAAVAAAAPHAIAERWPLVLTGGAAELPGMAEIAAAAFGAETRIGRPRAFAELEAAAAGASLAAAAGAFAWRFDPPAEARLPAPRSARSAPRTEAPKSLPALGAAWHWLRANF
jgi:cell division protein FtsA